MAGVQEAMLRIAEIIDERIAEPLTNYFEATAAEDGATDADISNEAGAWNTEGTEQALGNADTDQITDEGPHTTVGGVTGAMSSVKMTVALGIQGIGTDNLNQVEAKTAEQYKNQPQKLNQALR